ncbi:MULTISPECIES: TRAP transporter small permease [Pseudomonadota]|uniref:TRAP transporter small permease n=1 Tax=Pseudomonadota TaxID=1224 RepID=UPI003A931665
MRHVNAVEKALCVLSILAIVVLVLMQIFMRYVSGQSLAWSEELTSWFFLWMAWLGFSANYQKNEHISVGAIVDMVGGPIGSMLKIFVGLGSILFLGYLGYITYSTMVKPFIWRQSSVVLGLPVWILYLSVLAGCGLSVLRLVVGLFSPAEPEADLS